MLYHNELIKSLTETYIKLKKLNNNHHGIIFNKIPDTKEQWIYTQFLNSYNELLDALYKRNEYNSHYHYKRTGE